MTRVETADTTKTTVITRTVRGDRQRDESQTTIAVAVISDTSTGVGALRGALHPLGEAHASAFPLPLPFTIRRRFAALRLVGPLSGGGFTFSRAINK